MPRGRPIGSQIRQNIMTILAVAQKPLYGYLIHKIYMKVFPPCTREVIYYHLNKGIHLEQFALVAIKQEKGNFSWGGTVEKRYFGLGPQASPVGIDDTVQRRITSLLDEGAHG